MPALIKTPLLPICTLWLLTFIFVKAAYAVPIEAVIRRDGSFVVLPRSGTIHSLGQDRFTYSEPNDSGKTNDVWIVEATGKVRLLKTPPAVQIMCREHSPSIACISAGTNHKVLFHAQSHGKEGIISETGQFVLAPKFDYVSNVIGGRIKAYAGKQLFIFDEEGKPAALQKQCPIESPNTKNGTTISKGVKKFDFPSSVREVQMSADKWIAFAVDSPTAQENEYAREWGFMDRHGNVVIKPEFAAVGQFRDDVASAWIIDRANDRKCGLIDRSGKWLIKPTFNSISPGKNLFAVQTFEHTLPRVSKRSIKHDLTNLFQGKHVIGMTRDQLIELMGTPDTVHDDYISYLLSVGTDTSYYINFAFDKKSQLNRWAQQTFGSEVASGVNSWTDAETYK